MSKDTKTYDFEVYATGLVYSSVCTDMPKDKIAEHMGEHDPTGIDSPWHLADEDFKDGTPNGCDCPDKAGNKHYLMVC